MRIKDKLLNRDDLLEKFEYKDGLLFVKAHSQTYRIGKKTGTFNKSGYRIVMYNGIQFMMHRVIFLMHHGYLPECIDHIDRNKSNNKIENLRACTFSQNALNRRLHKNADTKYYGLIFMNYNKQPKYIVKLSVNGKAKFFGSYISIIEAILVYNREAVRYHGEFANLNIFGAV